MDNDNKLVLSGLKFEDGFVLCGDTRQYEKQQEEMRKSYWETIEPWYMLPKKDGGLIAIDIKRLNQKGVEALLALEDYLNTGIETEKAFDFLEKVTNGESEEFMKENDGT